MSILVGVLVGDLNNQEAAASELSGMIHETQFYLDVQQYCSIKPSLTRKKHSTCTKGIEMCRISASSYEANLHHSLNSAPKSAFLIT